MLINMKFLIVGCGSAGKRHLRNLIQIGIDKKNIGAVDPREDRLTEVKELGVNLVFTDLDKALNHEFDSGIICSPTSMHINQSIKLMNKNINILMEKPLCSDLNGIEELIKLKEKNNISFMMAYVFRFSPLTKKVRELLDNKEIGKILYVRGEFSEYLPDWHPWEDYRTFYMSKKELGGGSILDQSHIIDLFLFLFGNFTSVYAFNSKISNLETQVDDIAELIIEFDNNVIGSIHTDIFGRKHKKRFEIKGTDGNIIWDFYKKTITLYKSSTREDIIFDEFNEDFNQSYIDELNMFIRSCNDKSIEIPDLDVGIETMKLILKARKSHNSKKIEYIK